MPVKKKDTDRAIALLEDYCKTLKKPEEQQLKKAIKKVMGIFKSSLFQALLDLFPRIYPETTTRDEYTCGQFNQLTNQPANPTVQPNNRPNQPTNQPNQPTSRPNQPTNQPNQPTNPPNQPIHPTNQPIHPINQPNQPINPTKLTSSTSQPPKQEKFSLFHTFRDRSLCTPLSPNVESLGWSSSIIL